MVHAHGRPPSSWQTEAAALRGPDAGLGGHPVAGVRATPRPPPRLDAGSVARVRADDSPGSVVL
jgi:hypothetical protein